MFNNKKDPLVDAVKKIMEQNEKEREALKSVNEAFGVHSKKALPHELHGKYDAMLEEAKKCMYEEDDDKELSPKQKKLAAKAGDKDEIEAADLAKLRKDETLEEAKATEAQKEKVAKVMHKWKKGKEHIGKSDKTVPVTKKGQKQAVAIALSQAGLSKKKKMDESNSFNLVQEEIRISLLERINYIYENEGEDAANAFIETLSEEERGILEQTNLPSVPRNNLPSVPGRGLTINPGETLRARGFGGYPLTSSNPSTPLNSASGPSATSGASARPSTTNFDNIRRTAQTINPQNMLANIGRSAMKLGKASVGGAVLTSLLTKYDEKAITNPGIYKPRDPSNPYEGGERKIKYDSSYKPEMTNPAGSSIAGGGGRDVPLPDALKAPDTKPEPSSPNTISKIPAVGRQSALGDNERGLKSVTTFTGATKTTPGTRTDTELGGGTGATVRPPIKQNPTSASRTLDARGDETPSGSMVSSVSPATGASTGAPASTVSPKPMTTAKPAAPKEPVDREWEIAKGKIPNVSPTTSKYFSGGGGA